MFNLGFEKAHQNKSETDNKKEFARIQKDQFSEKVSNILDESEKKRVLKAFDLMTDLHLDQPNRIDGSPYFMHLVAAANNIVDFGVKDPNLISAALLHDSVEDQHVKLTYDYFRKKGYPDIPEKSQPAQFVDEKVYRKLALKGLGREVGDDVKKYVKNVTNPIIDDVVALIDDSYKKDVKFAVYKTQLDWKTSDEATFVLKLADLLNNIQTIEGKKKKYFQEKYGPVLRDIVIPKLEKVKEGDLLFKRKEQVLSQFQSIYQQDFENQF